MLKDPYQQLDRGDGVRLAYDLIDGRGPVLMFLPGYMSDMSGTKALALAAHARTSGQGMVRFDYSGCGASGGAFADGSLGRWRDDALAILGNVVQGPVILVGSSMGGWIALLMALARPQQVQGLVLVAPAPDFTEWGLELDSADRDLLADKGYIERPSDYGPVPYRYHRALLEDAPARTLLDKDLPIRCPVRLLHGQQDPDVPWELSLAIAERLQAADVRIALVKDGDHRLSRPQDLALLFAATSDLTILADMREKEYRDE